MRYSRAMERGKASSEFAGVPGDPSERAVFAAVITPSSDPYSMLAMMIPMVVFYEAAIIVGRLMKK